MERDFKLTGPALIPRKRTRKQNGGNSSGAPIQEAMQDTRAESTASQYSSQVGKVLTNSFGPSKIQQFGGNTGATVNLSSTRAASDPGTTPTPIVSGVAPSQPAPVGGGLVLSPPKRKTRISLKAKKGGSTANNIPPMPGGATRKARKIHLRVKGVTSRLIKAKKAKKDAMSAPISQVRSKLEAAGVIKKSSKAPEAMMRTMYADLLITKKGL